VSEARERVGPHVSAHRGGALELRAHREGPSIGSDPLVELVETTDAPGALAGFRIGVTAARKVTEQIGLLTRRGAEVEWAPALSVDPHRIDEPALRAETERLLSGSIDIFVATTGIGIRSWFNAAEGWGLLDRLLATLQRSEILARGPKSVGALRRRGLRELWSPESECFEDVLAYLRGRDLRGVRVVVQEHGQSLSMVAHALRRQGADVSVVTVYRIAGADDPEPLFRMVELIARRELDAVTFTAAPAVAALMEAAGVAGRRDDVVSAFQADVVATCVGPVTAAAFEMWGVPTLQPDRSRLAAMVKQMETELPSRRRGVVIEAAGHRVVLHGDAVVVDGADVSLSPAPLAVLHALAVNPGHVVSRKDLLAALPSGTAGSEHAVEMAVARLRAAIGTRLVQTVVKRGYRLAG
jgi:uroporphyrinogen-III synthase